MDIEQPTIEALVQHAERQTKALESINGALLFLLAIAILSAVVGLAVATS